MFRNFVIIQIFYLNKILDPLSKLDTNVMYWAVIRASLKSSPPFNAGPKKPQTLTTSKIKYENF